jgi:nucleoside-diphosphate-sugar epimerase
MAKLVITGGSGFLGRSLVAALKSDNELRVGFRCTLPVTKEYSCFSFDLNSDFDFSEVLEGVDCVIHTAAAVHLGQHRRMTNTEIFEINCAGTLRLANEAAQAGVKRFIFISTIGVNGECSSTPFKEEDLPRPANKYALSKYEAEKGLWLISEQTGLEIVVVRPPMIYGLGAPGNFAKIIKARPIWWLLPFGNIQNKRSFIYVGNLVNFIDLCIIHPRAANELFLIGDEESVSTSQFFQTVFEASGKKIKLVRFPEYILRYLFSVFGLSSLRQSLFGSASIDCSKAKRILGWEPQFTFFDGMLRSVKSCGKCDLAEH